MRHFLGGMAITALMLTTSTGAFAQSSMSHSMMMKMPACTAATGPEVWYVPSTKMYYAKGSTMYGKGSGKWVCKSTAVKMHAKMGGMASMGSMSHGAMGGGMSHDAMGGGAMSSPPATAPTAGGSMGSGSMGSGSMGSGSMGSGSMGSGSMGAASARPVPQPSGGGISGGGTEGGSTGGTRMPASPTPNNPAAPPASPAPR